MKRFFLYGVLVFLIGVATYIVYLNLTEKEISSGLAEHIRNLTPLQSRKAVFLYFSGKDGNSLISEERTVMHSNDSPIFAKNILEALIQGPRTELVRTVPAGTSVNAVFVMADQTAYVDFSEAVRDKHPGGAGTELITIYSIVNSLTLNIPDIHSVKLLIGGQEAQSLAGHVSLSAPFGANMLIIR